MELSNQKKLANHIFRLLKVSEIVIPIGRTNKGNLGIKFTAGQEDFEMYLDAIPLSTKDTLGDDNNIELKKMLEKYLFAQKEQFVFTSTNSETRVSDTAINIPIVKKKRGRPVKAK